MVSAEQSGAGNAGIPAEVGNRAEPPSEHQDVTPLQAARDRLSGVIALAMGIAATLIVLAGLFAVYDRVRTLGEAEARLGLVAGQIAQAVAKADIIGAQVILEAAQTDSVGAGVNLYLTDSGGKLVAATAEGANIGAHFDRATTASGAVAASATASGEFGAVTAIMPKNAALAGTGWRLVIVVAAAVLLLAALAGAIYALGKRQRDKAIAEEAAAVEAARRAARLSMNPGQTTVLNNLDFGLARWDQDGKMVWANPAYCRLLGIEEDAVLVGLAYDAVLSMAERPLFYKPIDEREGTRRTEVVCDDGTFLMAEERVVEDGGVMTLVTDITEHKHSDHALEAAREEQRKLARDFYEEKLKAEAASRAKTAFLAHLSHDIRTPLNHIIGFAELIQHQLFGPLGDERYESYVQDIRGSGEKLLASFAEIFELAQLEAGNTPIRVEQLTASKLFSTLETRFAERARRVGLDFEISIPEDVDFEGDKQSLARMLGNLVDNAIKFTPSGGTVKLAAWAAEDGLVLEVSDTGIGMAEERIALLSQPFILGESAFGNKAAGIGLGLAIARAIAEVSGGSLVIDSTPALGTTVAVALPRSGVSRSTQAAA
jgi:two-component system cell cycle sensor histidine kinase PleC